MHLFGIGSPKGLLTIGLKRESPATNARRSWHFRYRGTKRFCGLVHPHRGGDGRDRLRHTTAFKKALGKRSILSTSFGNAIGQSIVGKLSAPTETQQQARANGNLMVAAGDTDVPM